MIDNVLNILREEINGYLKRLPAMNIGTETKVDINYIAKPDGDIAIETDSLGLSLVNVEEERVVKSQNSVLQTRNGRVAYVNPEIKINLYILMVSNFKVYSVGLKFLSGAIRFFQSKNVFVHENTPGLDSSVEKLIVDLHTLNFEQQNNLWGTLGAKYLPSVLYKVRLITIQEAIQKDELPAVKGLSISEKEM